jgi:hypothetical protein
LSFGIDRGTRLRAGGSASNQVDNPVRVERLRLDWPEWRGRA